MLKQEIKSVAQLWGVTQQDQT